MTQKNKLQSTPVSCGHSRDRDLVSVLARVRNSGVRDKKKRKCICWIYGRRKCLDRLDELIQGDETAKLAYEEKKRGFYLMAARKRIVNERQKRCQATEVDYDCFASDKIFQSLSVITRVKTIKLCRRDQTKCP